MSVSASNGSDSKAGILHRLPAVSASEALRKASAAGNSIRTGSKQIDDLLGGGLIRGKVVEIHGPPGSGKTSVGVSAAARVLAQDATVVWIDCGFPVLEDRLLQAMDKVRGLDRAEGSENKIEDKAGHEHFHHYDIPALAYLLAFLLHPTPDFPPKGTQLLVIDSLSVLFASAFPHNYTPPSNTNARETHQQWAAARRWALQKDVASTLNKLAAVHDMAVLVTCQMSTRFDRDNMGSGRPKAMLRPSLSTKSWTDGMWARILLFRHWGPRQAQHENRAARINKAGEASTAESINRFAGLVKLGNVEHETCGRFVPFKITESGIGDVESGAAPNDGLGAVEHSAQPLAAQQPTGSAKRRISAIADSESDGEADDLYRALDDDDDDREEARELNVMGLTWRQQTDLEMQIEEEMNQTADDVFG